MDELDMSLNGADVHISAIARKGILPEIRGMLHCAGVTMSMRFATSGTTGDKKYVVHPISQMMDNASAFNDATRTDPDVVMYHCLDHNYMGGVLNTILCPAMAGGKTVIGSKFNPLRFWDEITDTGANTTWISPTMAAALVRIYRSSGDMKACGQLMDAVYCGFAPLSVDLRTAWMEAFGTPLIASYGTSEMMLVSVQSKASAEALDDHVGRCLPYVSPMIAGDGEILIDSMYATGVYVTNGIYEGFQRQGKHAMTGDYGRIEHGALIVAGRKKDVIKKGGVAISPAEIERAALSAGWVIDAAAVGVEDKFWGEKIFLFVEAPQEVAGLAAGSAYESCRSVLPKTHLPDKIMVVNQMPRTDTGKIAKAELRRIAAKG